MSLKLKQKNAKIPEEIAVGESKWHNTYIHVFMLICALGCILPFLLVLAISLTDEKALLTNGYSFWPSLFSLEAYKYLFKNPVSIIRGYAITIGTAFVGTLLSLLITSMAAYVLSRKDYPYRKSLNIFILITMLFNSGLVPWYLIYTNVLSFKDSLLALLIPNMLVSGFNVFVMRTFFAQSVPDGLVEAASIDGAGEFRTYWQIVLPLALPALAAIGFMTVLSYWNNWYNSMVFINDANKFSLQYLMTRSLLNLQALKSAMQMGNMSPDIAKAIADMPSNSVRMAMAVVGVGPMLFAFPFFQKYFVSGLTVGSVKG